MMNPNGQNPDAQAFLMNLLNALFGGQGRPGGMGGGMTAGGMGMSNGMGAPPSGGNFGMPSPPPTSMDGGMAPPTSGVPQMPKMNLPGSIDKPNAGQQPIGQSPYAGFNRGLPRQRY